MIYAQILNGMIQSCIVLNDPSLIPIFSQGFDILVRVDNLNPTPGIGWTTVDNINFIPPGN